MGSKYRYFTIKLFQIKWDRAILIYAAIYELRLNTT